MNRDKVRLAGICLATLFFELALVRFINSTVQVVAYFNNFLILSAFLGIGFGCVSASRRRTDWVAMLPPLLVVAMVLALWLDPFNPTGGAAAALVIWAKTQQKRSLAVLFGLGRAIFGSSA